ncbi:YajQ family cyclic di-GMP-binding protein [Hahella sp. SMD15-11]|uniref:Nucleotide-binding protein AAIA72_03660 n=1 Tax=Thermohahella caldifontis TaxID=3142973 RepID=A0AB39UY47_9GAMM
MPSFDIVSEFDKHELTNAVDQANRELTTRYDFRGVEASFELQEGQIVMAAEEEFQLEQMHMMLATAMSKRKLDLRILGEPQDSKSGKQVKRAYPLKSGIDQAEAKKLVKKIKDSKIKVQASIQGDQLRVTGKKRDDLQQVIQMLREDDSVSVPLQFQNFRD